MKRIIISLLALTISAHGMQMPPQPATSPLQSEKSYLEKLPSDLQRYLIPLLASTETLDQAIKNIQTYASVNHHFHALVNEPTNMETTLKLLIQRFKRQDNNNETKIIERLEKLQMPGIQKNPRLIQWFIERKAQRAQEIPLEEKLIEAAAQGDVATIATLIRSGVDINARKADFNARTALIKASRKGQVAVVKMLLDAGADMTIKDVEGDTALINAVDNDKTDIIKMLLERGIDPNIQSESGSTALIDAAMGYPPLSITIMQLLLDAGADISKKNFCGKDALAIARDFDHKENVTFLKRTIKIRERQAEAEKIIKEETEKLKVKDARIKELEAEKERLLKERP